MSVSESGGNDGPAGAVVDCVVIGSGFGGASVACRVAQAGRSVLVLERGKRYPPGSFPRTPLETSTNFWDPSQRLYGLFDVWSFRRFDAVVSSGVGGGSLIYANVLLRKPPEWFAREDGGEPWPVTYADLVPSYEQAERMLGVVDYPYADTTPKTLAFRRAAEREGYAWQLAPLAVSFSGPGQPTGMPVGRPEDNMHGVPRQTCELVGECDVGCNRGSKNTTDLTYLSEAVRRGAIVRDLHEVRRIIPEGPAGFRVEAVHHRPPQPAWDRTGAPTPPEPVVVHARTVVVSAGTLGSTYLLLRNRATLPDLSPRLGSRFSANGDYLGFIRSTGDRVLEGAQGPVITSYVRGADALEGDGAAPGARGFYVQDGGYPVVADWLAETLGVRPVGRLARVAGHFVWARLSGAPRTEVSAALTEAIGQCMVSRGTLPMLGMGRDLPMGRMRLHDGYLDIDWRSAYSRPVFTEIRDVMRGVARGVDGRFSEGPSTLLSRMITVHPLGGCPMGTDRQHGVVDDHGEVWGHPGLFVSDGSVMPGPVGANPSLTIAALGERFAGRVLERIS